MAVIPDDKLGIEALLAADVVLDRASGKLLKVDLVHDAVAGRNHPQILECIPAPAQKRKALPIDLNLAPLVETARLRRAVMNDRHRMIDDEVGLQLRVDLPGIGAARRQFVA